MWSFKRDAPLKMRYDFDFSKYKWLIQFMNNIKFAKENTIETTRMAMESIHLMRTEFADIEYDQSDCGIMHIYKNEKDLAQARKVNELYKLGGLSRTEINPNMMKLKEPKINIENCVGGMWTGYDAVGDIHKFCVNLAKKCETMGVKFRYDTRIDWYNKACVGLSYNKKRWRLTDRHKNDLHYEGLVICGGVYSRKIGKELGDNIPIYPVKGYSVSINIKGQEELAPKVSILDDEAKIVTSTLGDRLRVAGTAEFNGQNRDIRIDRITPLMNWVRKYFPKLELRDYKPWAGLRPMTPNMMPIVKVGKCPNVWYNTGHGHLGWTLSAYTARQITEIIDE
jgi:D-amino-acid dehydrogenase